METIANGVVLKNVSDHEMRCVMRMTGEIGSNPMILPSKVNFATA